MFHPHIRSIRWSFSSLIIIGHLLQFPFGFTLAASNNRTIANSNRINVNNTLKIQPNTIVTKRMSKRPLYSIAHMVNSLKEIDEYIAKGCNGLETDVFFAPNATPVFMFHGYPCDCFRHCAERERVDVFLERIRELTTPNSRSYNPKLIILFLDLKLLRIQHSAKALAGQNLATVLLEHLYNGTTAPKTHPLGGAQIKTVISIGHVFDYDFILGFQNEFESQGKSWLFRDYIGWDVGMNDPLFVIESMWKRFDTVHNIWQGDGRSNCVSPFYNLARLSAIVKKRDATVIGFNARNLIRKVYQWTVDLTVNIRTALRQVHFDCFK
ncbi:hypothetical protein RDWZM_002722 [Blomia tropicalis]|uniref:Uncharacterized protein n=1 Tax=Blomia tropicalis TaxID=40697 RepID=A0A9Q0MGU8_BLOTA|nr:hypothetical protein RDWZM_002722 [Blomia tropicalis]